MKKVMLIASMLATSISCSALEYEQDNKYKNAANLIDVWLQAQSEYQNIPFISAAIVKDQKVIWSNAFGTSNVAENISATEQTMSSICSTSKVFTATAIMKLVDDGKIALNDKVSDLLPNFKVKQVYKNSKAITVASLLNHTSGLPRDTEHGYWGGPIHNFPSDTEFYSNLANLQTQSAVGEKVAYSNIGYTLLGKIVERASEQSLNEYMTRSIFQPLNMYNSVIELPSSLYGNQHAIGYTAKNRQGQRSKASFYQTQALQGAAGMSTTALDITEFIKWQFRLMANKENEILKQDTLNAMHQVAPDLPSSGQQRGLGYIVAQDHQGNNWSMHGGICPGYVSFLKMDTSNKIGYVFLANANKVNAHGFILGLNKIINLADESLTLSDSQTNTDFEQYTGFYDLRPWNSEYYVANWQNGLMLLYLPATSLKYALQFYQHLEGDRFQLVENGKKVKGEIIHFIRDENDKVIKVKNGGSYHSKITQ